jgi:Fe-S oxidoreductase
MAPDELAVPRLDRVAREIHTCSRCGFCRIWDWKGVRWVCPTYPYTEGYDTQYARGRLTMAQAVQSGQAQISQLFLEHLAQCCLCGSCATHCPAGIPLAEVWHALRADLAEQGHLLEAHRQVAENVRDHHNVFGPVRRSANAPVEEARPVKVLYFAGCQTNRKARQIRAATVELLGKLGSDFAVIGDAVCCGYPLYEIGAETGLRDNAAYTAGRIAAYRPDVILTTCIGCYRALHNLYPQELGVQLGGAVMHAHDFFAERLPANLAPVQRRVTFHDPCIMVRNLGIVDEPRALLRRIPGLELVEMYSNREDTLCCGAGGGVLSAFTDIAGRVAEERVRQAADAGAAQLVTSCPSCVVNLKRSVSRAGVDVQVSDIVELLNEAVPVG